MTPFARGKAGIQYIYVPTGPGSKQLSTGTTSLVLARRLDAMCKALADEKQWELLRALVIKPQPLTIDRLWDAYRKKALDTLRAELSAVRLVDFLDGWTADAKAKAPATWGDQRKHVDLLLAKVTYAHELKPGRIRDLLNQETGGGGTKRHKLYAWSAFCRYLVVHDVLDSNPCADRDKVPRPPKANKRTVWRTADVDQAIIARTSGDVRIALVLCAASGADRSTVARMHVRDLHLLAVGAKPDKAKGLEHRVDLPGTKTAGRNRKGVRLEPWAAPILREWCKGKLPSVPLIGPVGPRTITMAWHDAAEAEGHAGYWLRDTRHSYGIRALMDGYPLWEISKWLGHASEALTAEIYLQFDYEVARLIRQGTAGDSAAHTTPDTTAASGSDARKEA